MKKNIKEAPKFGLGSFIARSAGFWILFVILFDLILDIDSDMSTGISLLLGMGSAYAQFFTKQLDYLNHTKQEILQLENDIDIMRDHLRQLKRNLLPDPTEHDRQANLVSQIHRYEDRFTQDKLTYNSLIRDYNSALRIMPVRFLARRFGHVEKDYFSDFFV